MVLLRPSFDLGCLSSGRLTLHITNALDTLGTNMFGALAGVHVQVQMV